LEEEILSKSKPISYVIDWLSVTKMLIDKTISSYNTKTSSDLMVAAMRHHPVRRNMDLSEKKPSNQNQKPVIATETAAQSRRFVPKKKKGSAGKGKNRKGKQPAPKAKKTNTIVNVKG
jgi:hypothetical protein